MHSFGKFVIVNQHNNTMKISIGNDHAGPEYKKAIVAMLEAKGHVVTNYGTDTFDSVDYPDFAHLVARDITDGKAELGVIICGSGNGIAITANKHSAVRAALCWIKEIAVLARQHNNANVISIPARYTSIQQAVEMVESFINTDFEGGRHQTRVDKMCC